MSTQFPFQLDDNEDEELGKFPFELPPEPQVEDSLLDTVVKSVKQTIPLLKSSAGGLIRSVGEGSLVGGGGELSEALYKLPPPKLSDTQEEIKETLVTTGEELRTEGQKEAQALEPQATGFKGFVGDVAGTTTRMLPAILAGAITRNPNVGLGVIFPDVYGEAYGEAREKGLKVDDAILEAGVKAGSEILTERIPLGILTRKGGTILPRVLKAAGAEGLQEYVQAGVERLVNKGVLRDEMTIEEAFDELLKPETQREMLYSAAVGAAVGGGFGFGIGAAEKAFNPAATPPDVIPLEPKDIREQQFIQDLMPQKEPQIPEHNAVRRGEISGDGAFFSEPGSSTYYDPESEGVELYKYAPDIRIADPFRDQEARSAILIEAYNNLDLPEPEKKRIKALIDDPEAPINYIDYEELGLSIAAKNLGYDGFRMFENDDIDEPSTVNVWNLNKVQLVPKVVESTEPFIIEPTPRDTITPEAVVEFITQVTDPTLQLRPLRDEKVIAFLQAGYEDAKSLDITVSGVSVAGFDKPKAFVQWPKGTAKMVHDTVAEWRRRFAPHLRINISDGDPEIIAHAALRTEESGRLFDALRRSRGMMYQVADGAYNIVVNPARMFSTDGVLNERSLYETLAHEFGHALSFDLFHRSPKEVQEAVIQAYGEWHSKVYTEPLIDLIHDKFTLGSATRWSAYYEELLGPEAMGKPLATLMLENSDVAGKIAYLLNMKEWMADQFARYATAPTQGLSLVDRFFKKAAALIRRMYALVKDKYESTKAFEQWLQTISELRFEDNVIRTSPGATIANDLDTLSRKVPNLPLDKKQIWRTGGQIDRFNKVMEHLYTIRQIAQLNPHITGLQKYITALESMAATKNKLLHRTEERLIELGNLGKSRLNNVGRFLLEETVGGKFFDLTDQKIIDQYKLDAGMVEVIKKIKEDFTHVLDRIEATLAADLIDRYINDPATLQRESQKLHTQINRMKSVPYFPLARFGNYSVVVRAKSDVIIDGRLFKAGTVIDMRTFKKKSEQERGAKEARNDYAGKDVGIGLDLIEDAVFQFQGIPPQVFDTLEKELTLSPRQKEALKQYRLDAAPGRSFLKHLKRRNKVYGFSEDIERAYADYMQTAANHIARISHYKALNAAKAEVAQSATSIQHQEGNATKRRQIHQYMEENYNYVMNPQNEWVAYRSFAYLYWLGGNVKSAFIQSTQIALTTYPQLATDFNDAAAVASIGKAIKWSADVWRNPAKLPPEYLKALKQGEDAGFINQSFASLVAGVADGHVLDRVLPGSKGARLIRHGSYYASWMFSKMELLNRRITFLAAFDLKRKSGASYDQAYQYAKTVVQDTQLEYSKWNRPKLFRGKKGVFFIFKMYMQGMLYFFLHNKARIRFIATLSAMGGLMALPFAEDLMDMIDWAMSDDNEKFDVRREMREFLAELDIKPDLIMHGVGRESLGFAALADFIGVPFPRVDISGSVSLGRIIPGFEGIMRAGTAEERLGRAATDAAGAGIAVPLAIASVALEYDRHPDKARLIERALPAALRQGARAIRWGAQGGETDPRGAMKMPMSWQDTEQRMEIIAGALGFQPTRLAERREQDEMFKRHAEFYMARQSKLLQDFAYVYSLRDREGIADARKAIRQYNMEVPDPRLRISGQMLKRSVVSRMRNIRKLERGLPLEGKKFIGLYREIDRLFPDEEIEKRVLENALRGPDLPFTD